jgi:protein TonB
VSERRPDERPPARRAASEIVDTILKHRVDRPRRRNTLAALFVVAIYGGAALLTFTTRVGLGPWSADLAARIHADLANERAVEVLPPPVEAPPPAARPPASAPLVRAASRQARRVATAAPAQAAAVITRAAPEAPLDLTNNAFASGAATTFPGGATAGAGKSTAPVEGNVDLHAPPASRPTLAGADLARPVTLAAGTWVCPWPPEADAEQIDEQTVVIRVRVRADGTVETAQVIADPGAGFGRAALTCARQTRFEPARGGDGTVVASWSPPIRVHFSR